MLYGLHSGERVVRCLNSCLRGLGEGGRHGRRRHPTNSYVGSVVNFVKTKTLCRLVTSRFYDLTQEGSTDDDYDNTTMSADMLEPISLKTLSDERQNAEVLAPATSSAQ